MRTIGRHKGYNGHCGLFTLLLILILGAVTVHGSHSRSGIFRLLEKNRDKLKGGDSYNKDYQLKHNFTGRYVQMRFGGKRRVDARGQQMSKFTRLTFKSGAGGTILIQGVETGKYLCFNRKGRLVLKLHRYGIKCRFREEFYSSPHTYLEEVSGEVSIRIRSEVNKKWFVGFRKNGKPLPGWAIESPRKEKFFVFRKIHPRTRKESPLAGVDEDKLFQRIKSTRVQKHR